MTVWAVIVRDLRQIRRHGLFLLLFFAFILLLLGNFGIGLVASQFDQWSTEVPGWTPPGWTDHIASGVANDTGDLPSITLLDVVYGYAVLITLFIVPITFVTGYNHEMKRGTVRTLTLYPLGVLHITLAKLLYAAIVGFIISFIVFLIPVVRLGRETGVVLGIFLTAYAFTLAVLAVGAFLAMAIALGTGRMRIRPTSLGFLAVLFAFIFSVAISGFFFGFLGGLLLGSDGGMALVETIRPLAFLSAYHQGGLVLNGLLGGPGVPDAAALGLTVLVLALTVWATRRLYPDVFERE